MRQFVIQGFILGVRHRLPAIAEICARTIQEDGTLNKNQFRAERFENLSKGARLSLRSSHHLSIPVGINIFTLTNIIEMLIKLGFESRTNQEDLPMQKSRKLPVLASVAVFVAALAFGLSPSLAQNRGARTGAGVGAGYGTGIPHGGSGSHYGSGGASGVYGPSNGGGSQSLRDVFRGLNPGDQLRLHDPSRQNLTQQ
jgi:hypothetical protein